MERIDRCDYKMKRTWLIWIVDLLCGVLLFGITVWVACRYTALPNRIPIHYNAGGVIDGYGDKSMIWGLLAIMWIIVIVMSVSELFPKCWNIPFKVMKENTCRLLTIIWHFISTTKLLVACLLAYMVVMCVRGENLLAWFAPMVVTVFCVNSLFWVIRLFLSRQ